MAGNTWLDFNAPKNHEAKRNENGGLREPIITEVGYKTWCINELGCNNMYVLEGTERAAVIDAGMGYCNFRRIVESLTDKPYDVLITHAHPDHIGMMHQFDRVYVSETDVVKARPRMLNGVQVSSGGMDTIRWLTRPDFDMEEFVWNNRQHIGHWEIWNPDESVICRGDLDTEICYVKEGDTFDLGGGRVITAYEFPFHSPGHMYYIDSGEKIAFTGDCVNFNNGAGEGPVSKHLRYCLRMRKQYEEGLFKRTFTGHSTYCGIIDVMSQEIEVLDNMIELDRRLLRGEKVDTVEIPNHLHPEMPPRKGVAYGEGVHRVQVAAPSILWEEGEEHIVP